MSNLNLIGLDAQKAESLSVKLNALLANFQIYYQNLRGFHWNIKGNDFFELHEKFEELYTEAHTKIDELAERILTLGFTPHHAFSTYIENASIKEARHISGGRESVELTLVSLQTLLKIEREALEAANQLHDEGSVDLLTGLIQSQEKVVWMLSSWLKK